MESHRLARVVGIALAVVAVPLVAGQTSTGRESRLLSPADLAARLKDPQLVILHVVDRRGGYDAAHIPGARPIRYDDVAVDGADELGAEVPPLEDVKRVFEEAGVSGSSHVVLYGNTVAAARVFFTLDVAGHEHVALLDGGLPAWQAEKRPVASGPPAPFKRGTWSPTLRADRMATAQWIQQQAGKFALVDVRPDEEFTGSDGGMAGVHAPGHINGAKQLPWNALVGPDGRFLPESQLREKLAAAGAASGKPVVSYCMVGMRASVVYFVARHLGFDAKLYDGSIVDWSRRKLPTARGR